MLKPPGQTKFKLQRLTEPIINKTTGMKYDFVCLELQQNTCNDCWKGWIYVAYGLKDGIYDVFRFPCHCRGGLELGQLVDVKRYKNRPVDEEYSKDMLPPYVFIHPIHNSEYQHVVRTIKGILEKVRQEQMEETEVPF